MRFDKRTRYFIFSLKKPNKKIIESIVSKCDEIDAVLTYNVVWLNEDIRLFGYIILRKKPAKLSNIIQVFNDIKFGKNKLVMSHLKHDNGDEWLKSMKENFTYAGPLTKNGKKHPLFDFRRKLTY